MPHTSVRLVIAVVLVAAGLRWIIDSNPWSGPVVVQLSATHGVHSNDWLSFVLWAMATALVAPARTLRLALRRFVAA